jgi:opacity protein-like surface antigen
MRSVRPIILAAALTFGAAGPAFADLTAFIGATTSPETRPVRGIGVGAGLLLVGFEFEYASASDDPDALAPSLKTGMINGLLQAPFAIFRLQPYVTAGAGVYREALGAREETGFGMNMGAGVKVSLAGPLRLRVDYRALRLGRDALETPVHRVYAGLNLKF